MSAALSCFILTAACVVPGLPCCVPLKTKAERAITNFLVGFSLLPVFQMIASVCEMCLL